MNDPGFQQFSDLIYGGAELAYRRLTPGRHLREWSVTATPTEASTFGGETAVRQPGLAGDALFHSLRGFWWRLDHSRGTLSPHVPRRGPALREQPHTQARITLHSDRRRAVSGEIRGTRRILHGASGHRTSVRGSLKVRPSSRRTLSVLPEVARVRQPAQFVATVRSGPEPRFRALDPSTLTRDPEGGRIEAEDDVGAFSFGDPDFKVRTLNGNAVVRWEFTPGSTLFLVWTREREAPERDADLRLGSDLREILGSGARDALIVKVSYWFNP